MFKEMTAIFLILIFSIGTILAVFGYKALQTDPTTVDLIAQEPKKGNWSPRIIQVEKGKKTTLKIRNIDVMTHGFYLPELDILIQEIKAGEVKEVLLNPKVAGEYPFYCAVWCSDNHMSMTGTLVVK